MKEKPNSELIAFAFAVVVWIITAYLITSIILYNNNPGLAILDTLHVAVLVLLKPNVLLDTLFKTGTTMIFPLLTFIVVRRRFSK
ncbi:MAG: hypothetical protein LBH98_00685 [Chitinispirillales bacterium]|jgi:hypothetical protein|nr:hypothetical protein [Chitinispirillales bacterium]